MCQLHAIRKRKETIIVKIGAFLVIEFLHIGAKKYIIVKPIHSSILAQNRKRVLKLGVSNRIKFNVIKSIA